MLQRYPIYLLHLVGSSAHGTHICVLCQNREYQISVCHSFACTFSNGSSILNCTRPFAELWIRQGCGYILFSQCICTHGIMHFRPWIIVYEACQLNASVSESICSLGRSCCALYVYTHMCCDIIESKIFMIFDSRSCKHFLVVRASWTARDLLPSCKFEQAAAIFFLFNAVHCHTQSSAVTPLLTWPLCTHALLQLY